MKYEFVPGDEITIAPGRTVKRIRALVSIAAIGLSAGDLGGYVEAESNLSRVSGDAWVSGNARVYGDAWVYGDAQVSGDARVYGNARVSGNARVYGNAQVYGDAWVYGDAQVYGDAWVESYSDWVLVGPAKSSGRFTTAYKDEKIGVRVACGCFTGTLDEFESAIRETHADSPKCLAQYLAFHAAIKASLIDD